MSILRLHHVPLVAVMLALIALALLLGKRAVTTTETQVIERVADRYVREVGGDARRMDCAAVPAQSAGLWLVVSCRGAKGGGFEYFIDRFGRVAHTGHASQGTWLLPQSDAARGAA